MQVRPATLADVPAIQGVYRRSSLSNEGDRAALLARPETLVWSGAAISEGRTRVATADDGVVVGFITTRRAGNSVELEDLFVDPPWMRRGAGRVLIDDAVATASRLGAGRLEVTANRHAFAFYNALGFVVDGDVSTELGRGLRMHRSV